MRVCADTILTIDTGSALVHGDQEHRFHGSGPGFGYVIDMCVDRIDETFHNVPSAKYTHRQLYSLV